MERPRRNSLLALLAGVAVAGGLYWLGGWVSLALVTGLSWAVGVKLTLRVGRLYPEYATGETLADKRWTGLSVGVVTMAALLGVSPSLPLSDELRFGLGVLVLGAGTTAYAAGTLAVLERVESGSETPPAASDGDASYPASDD